MRIALDVGHLPTQQGAISASGKYEYQFNKRFVYELRDAGRKTTPFEFVVIDAANRPKLKLGERPAIAKAKAADVFISIHHDSVNNKYLTKSMVNGKSQPYSDAFSGFSVFVSPENPRYRASVDLARMIARRFKRAGMTQTLHHAEKIPNERRKLLNWDLGVYEAPFVVIKRAKLTAILLELGVIINPRDEERLERPAYRAKIADAILAALDDYCIANLQKSQKK